ncbi:MAG: GGDEF domain-containing protein [Clostridia bacterium]
MMCCLADSLKKLAHSEFDKAFFKENRCNIQIANLNVLCRTSALATALCLLLALASLVIPPLLPLMPLYFIFCGMFGLIFIISNTLAYRVPAFILPLFYVFLFAAFVYSTILGIVNTPNGTATTFMVVLVIIPLLILDRPWHTNLFVMLTGLAFCIFTYIFKAINFAMVDMINCVSFMLLSMFINHLITNIKLRDISNQRLLVIQRDTDSLTMLPNRRKLYETLAASESGACAPITGVIMVDIDYFKLYNDSYGHQAGDDCLRLLGKRFAIFAKANSLSIFRYGGEEFIALSYTHNYEALGAVSNELVSSIRTANIPFDAAPKGKITICCGFAYANNCRPQSYETLISMADKALYHAKGNGKDTVAGYLDCID